jgi:hypothetical protein
MMRPFFCSLSYGGSGWDEGALHQAASLPHPDFLREGEEEGRPSLEVSALPDLYVRERTEAVFGLKDYELAR